MQERSSVLTSDLIQRMERLLFLVCTWGANTSVPCRYDSLLTSNVPSHPPKTPGALYVQHCGTCIDGPHVRGVSNSWDICRRPTYCSVPSGHLRRKNSSVVWIARVERRCFSERGTSVGDPNQLRRIVLGSICGESSRIPLRSVGLSTGGWGPRDLS